MLCRPFRACVTIFHVPRALPWADMLVLLRSERTVRNFKTYASGCEGRESGAVKLPKRFRLCRMRRRLEHVAAWQGPKLTGS
jgi:hypothetical protein